MCKVLVFVLVAVASCQALIDKAVLDYLLKKGFTDTTVVLLPEIPAVLTDDYKGLIMKDGSVTNLGAPAINGDISIQNTNGDKETVTFMMDFPKLSVMYSDAKFGMESAPWSLSDVKNEIKVTAMTWKDPDSKNWMVKCMSTSFKTLDIHLEKPSGKWAAATKGVLDEALKKAKSNIIFAVDKAMLNALKSEGA